MGKFSKKRAHTPEDDESAGEQTLKPSKKAKGEKSGKTTDADGPFWEVCYRGFSMSPRDNLLALGLSANP
jgi:hypothetical protein